MESQTQAPVIVHDLHKSFGAQRVLDGISLEVARGETVAVLGKSGTGKSVFLKLLIGLQAADGGSVRIEGREITKIGTKELNEVRKKVGFLFQQGALYDSLTVEENVAFPLERHTDSPEEECHARARELLSSVGMEKDIGKLPSEISGGMQKRVGLARALALDPEILLFDEPTAGLDPITAGGIGKLILELKDKRKMTAVVVTHDIHGARTFADRMLLIDRGRVVIEGSFEDLRKSHDEFVAEFFQECR